MNQKWTKGYEKNVFFWAWSELPLPPTSPPPDSVNQWQGKPFLNKGATPPGRGRSQAVPSRKVVTSWRDSPSKWGKPVLHSSWSCYIHIQQLICEPPLTHLFLQNCTTVTCFLPCPSPLCQILLRASFTSGSQSSTAETPEVSWPHILIFTNLHSAHSGDTGFHDEDLSSGIMFWQMENNLNF